MFGFNYGALAGQAELSTDEIAEYLALIQYLRTIESVYASDEYYAYDLFTLKELIQKRLRLLMAKMNNKK